MDRDEIKGKFEKGKGKVKEKAGEIMNDPDLEASGEADQVEGEVQEGFGTAKRKTKETVDELTDDEE